MLGASWLHRKDPRVNRKGGDYRGWWKTFGDPVLDRLIQTAYRQNPPLREAGLRILQARKQLGIAVGDFYQQKQDVSGFVDYLKLPEGAPSERLPGQTGALAPFWWSGLGLGASW